MGGLRKKMPITFWTFLIATLALSGVPPFSGFFSKDEILISSLLFGMEHPAHLVIFVIMLLSAGITAFYMFRLIFMTFFGEPKDKEKYDHAHESPWTMTVPLMVLAALSIGPMWWGWVEHLLEKPELASFATTAVESLKVENQKLAHSAHFIAMVTSIPVALSGILLAAIIYYWKKISAEIWGQRLKPIYNLLWNKYYFDEIYQATFIGGTLAFSRLSALFDAKVIDGFVNAVARMTTRLSLVNGLFDLKFIDGIVNFVGNTIWKFGAQLREVQTGKVQNYILMTLFAIILLFIMQQF